MNPLVQSMTNASTTLNGGATNASSLNPVVDLFFQIGAMRGWDSASVVTAFSPAFNHNPEQALKVLFWARDIRQGTGERQIFRTVCQHLAGSHTEVMSRLIPLIPEYGRWDDLFVFVGTELESDAIAFIKKTLEEDCKEVYGEDFEFGENHSKYLR